MKNYYRSLKYRVTHFTTRTQTFRNLERHLIGNITAVKTKEPLAALTFDGGPDIRWTPKVLDILGAHNVRATFFVIGKFASQHSEIIHEISNRGHILGNHTWDHPSLPLLSTKELRWQVEKCSEVLGKYNTQLFRPPYGHLDKKILFELWKMKRKVITWDVHPFDWQDRDPDWMFENMAQTVKPGSIILLHDAVCVQRMNTREHMLKALDKFLVNFGSTYRFVTVLELLKAGAPIREVWIRKPAKDFFETHVLTKI